MHEIYFVVVTKNILVKKKYVRNVAGAVKRGNLDIWIESKLEQV